MKTNYSSIVSTRLISISISVLALVVFALIGLFSTREATAYDPVLAATGRPDCNVQTQGLVTIESHFDVDETVARLEAEITNRGLGVFAIIDHQANAESVDLELRPTTLVLFGSPTVGTILMQSEQGIGIDLPLKFLVWEDECGTVRIGYNSPDFLKRRHAIRDRDQVFSNISGALEAISSSAATP